MHKMTQKTHIASDENVLKEDMLKHFPDLLWSGHNTDVQFHSDWVSKVSQPSQTETKTKMLDC